MVPSPTICIFQRIIVSNDSGTLIMNRIEDKIYVNGTTPLAASTAWRSLNTTADLKSPLAHKKMQEPPTTSSEDPVSQPFSQPAS